METTSKQNQKTGNQIKSTAKKLTITRKNAKGKDVVIQAVKGNVNEELIPRGEQDLVHFYIRDYSIPKSGDLLNQKQFERLRKVMTKQEFLMCFKSNYENTFKNVNSPEAIYRILINMDATKVSEFYSDEINPRLKGLERREHIEKVMLPRKGRLSLNGGNFYVLKEDFIHVPDLEKTTFPDFV